MRLAIIVIMVILFIVPVAAQEATGVVQVNNNPTLGSILVAPNGMTLYTFGNDQPGVSNCIGQCLELWPAYTVDASASLTPAPGVPGAISVIVQADGLLHVTYDGKPLYFYSSDVQPGDVNGQGVGNVWFAVPVVVTAPPVASEFLLDVGTNRDLGSILISSNGMTLYTFANDQPSASNCIGQCVELWPPYTVDPAANMIAAPGIPGAISTILRSDGLTQTVLDGRPLYFYSGDTEPGDVNGQGVGNVWFSVPLDAVRVGGTADRPLLVAANGRTLYTFANDEPNWSNCIGDCITNWPPLAASGADAAVISSSGVEGALGTTLRADNTYQVTFNSRPVYLFVNDAAPGDTNGDGAGGVWSVVPVAPVVRLGGNLALGSFATDSSYRTLYVFANDTEGVSNCVDNCAVNWPPLTVPAGTSAVAQGYLPGTLGTIQRTDGTTQVTLDGRPLYFFANDVAPGDANGNGAGGVWSVVLFDIPFEAPATCSVTPVNNTANLRQAPTTVSASPRSVNFGDVLTIDGQALSEGFVWWHLTSGEWVRSDVVSEVTPCVGVPSLAGGVQAPVATVDASAPAATPEVVAPASTPEVGG
jgi:predicted lipoprotein with Yx(FWY)xxD motif